MRSMTGCGRASAENASWRITADLRAVNHRYLDIACRLPRSLSFLEEVARREVTACLHRGHVEVSLHVDRLAGSAAQAQVDTALALSLAEAAARLQTQTGLQSSLTVGELMRLEGVVTLAEAEVDEEEVSALCAQALREALTSLVAMRIREGRAMRDDLACYLDSIEASHRQIAALAPQVAEEYRERLRQRLDSLPVEPVDEVRLAQEVAIFADRCAIDEELARLAAHIRQARAWLTDDQQGEAGVAGEIGKKLDFLIQEMNRETNTIGSKANHAGIAMAVVQLKSDIEKLREQAQNIE